MILVLVKSQRREYPMIVAANTPSSSALDESFVGRTPGSGWRGFPVQLWFSFWKLFTNPFSLGFAIGLPVFMYLIFGTSSEAQEQWVVNSNVSAIVLVNMAVYGTIMTASSMGTNVALERTSGITRLYALTPISSGALIAARVIASMLVSLIVTGIVFCVGAASGARMESATWASTLGLIVAVTALPIALGLACAFGVRSDGAFALTSAFTVTGSFAAGMFIPLEQMGGFWQSLAPYTPFYGLVSMVQTPLFGWDSFEWGWLGNYLFWMITFLALSIWAQRHDTSR